MTQNRFYSSVYPPTTLAAAIVSPSATTISVASTTTEPGSFPYTMLIDWGLPTQEAVSVTAASGSGPYTLTVTRGIDGTTAQTHLNGAIIVHGVTAQDYNEPQVHMATGTSGASYPNVIHGLANGSTVVGTTDTQTLTNKTLGTTPFTGPVSASAASSTGEVWQVTNTTAAPSNPNGVIWNNSSTDAAFGIRVTGDTKSRLESDSSGKLKWGPGGASSSDTNFYRNTAGELKTDESLTVTANLTMGGAQLLAGGSGVTGVNNAATTPTTTPSGGYVSYAKNGFMKFRGADGLDYNTGHTRAFLSAPFTTASASGAQTVTGLSLALGAFTYELDMWLPYTGVLALGTVTFAFTFSGTTSMTSLTGQFETAAYTAPSYISTITTGFTSPTLTTSDTLFLLRGLVTVSGAGTLQLTATNTISADETSVLAGAFIKASVVA